MGEGVCVCVSRGLLHSAIELTLVPAPPPLSEEVDFIRFLFLLSNQAILARTNL